MNSINLTKNTRISTVLPSNFIWEINGVENNNINSRYGYTNPTFYIITISVVYELNNIMGFQLSDTITRYFMVDKLIIKNLISNFDYLNEYIEYISGNYSKDEFKIITHSYSKEVDDEKIEDIDILYATKLISDIMGKDYSDLSTIVSTALNISHDRLENSYKNYLENK